MCVPIVTTNKKRTTSTTTGGGGGGGGGSRSSSMSSSSPQGDGETTNDLAAVDDKPLTTTAITGEDSTSSLPQQDDDEEHEDDVETLLQDITAALVEEEEIDDEETAAAAAAAAADDDEDDADDDITTILEQYAADIDIDLHSLLLVEEGGYDDGTVQVDDEPLAACLMKNVGFVRFKDEKLVEYHEFPKHHYYHGACGSRNGKYTATFLASYYGKNGSNESGSSQDHANHRDCDDCYYNKDILWWSEDEIQKIELDAFLQLETIVAGTASSDDDQSDNTEDNNEEGVAAKRDVQQQDYDDVDDDEDEEENEEEVDLNCKLRGLERILYGLYDEDYSDKKREAIQSMLLHLNTTKGIESSTEDVIVGSEDDTSSTSTSSGGGSGSNGSNSSSTSSSCTTIYKDFVSECMTRAKTYAVVDERFVKREQQGVSLEKFISQVQNEQLQSLLRRKQRQVELANMRIQQEDEWLSLQKGRQEDQQRTCRALSLPITLSMTNFVSNYSCISTTRKKKGADTAGRSRRGRCSHTRRPVTLGSKVSKAASTTLPVNSKKSKLLGPVELNDEDYMIHEDEIESSDPPSSPPPHSSPPPTPPSSPTPEEMISSVRKLPPPSPTSVLFENIVGIVSSPIPSSRSTSATKATKLLVDKLTSGGGGEDNETLSLCVPRLLQASSRRLVEPHAQKDSSTNSSSMNTMCKRVSAIYNYCQGSCRNGSDLGVTARTHQLHTIPKNLDWEDFLTE